MISCPRCGEDNEQDSRFCKHCGQNLSEASVGLEDEDTLILRLLKSESAEEQPEVTTARIWVLDPTGEHVERDYELKDEITLIGRREDCAISLPSNTVSRRHAQIRREGNSFLISDLGSTNGTLLNQEPVIGEEQLNDRDEIAIGTFKLIFRYV